MARPLISICIPAYKRIDSLARLLDSISKQKFEDYEIIVTDDSDDESVAQLVEKMNLQKITYYKNPMPLGSPANWNEGIRRAKGDWIKLMHDDDWFANENSLGAFAEATRKTDSPFIFSGFENVELDSLRTEVYVLPDLHHSLLKQDPLNLFKMNFIGHPSTTLINSSVSLKYDERFMWVVDIEFYVRVLRAIKSFYVIREPLIKIGQSSTQITKLAFRNPSIEVPENLYLLRKLSPLALKNIFVFDYYWRLLRNLSIRSVSNLQEFAEAEPIPMALRIMIAYQRKLPLQALKLGALSKSTMFSCYVYCRLAKVFTR